MSNRGHRTKTALQIALSRFWAIVCPCFCLLLGACATPKITTFDHAPDPKLRQEKPFPANLAVLPWDDRREFISYASPAFCPFMLFGTDVLQMSKQKRYEKLSGPREEAVRRLVKRYFSECNIFQQVGYLENGVMAEPQWDYELSGVLNRYASRETVITYGVSYAVVALYLAGFPWGRFSWDLDFEWRLREAVSGRFVAAKRYQTRVKQPLNGLPWGAWIYGKSTEYDANWEFETVLPFLRSSFEDFLAECRSKLPPLENAAYWTEIANQRAERVARVMGTPTRIELAYPRDGLTVREAAVPLRGDAISTVALKSVEVLANGDQVALNDLSTSPGANRQHVAIQVAALPLRRGENIIQVKARNVADREDSKTLTVVYQPPEPPIVPSPPASSALAASKPVGPRQPPITRPKRWAVVIGISKYKDSQIPRLRYAADDARAFYEWLIDPKGGGYDPTCVKLLLNEKATATAVRDALWTWLQQPIAEDTVVIYFAGHGSPQSPDQPKNLFLLPYDTDYGNIAATAFPMWDVRTAVEKFIKARRVVILADACHSAGVGSEFDIVRRSGRAVTAVPITSGLGDLSNVGAGVVVLTASDEGEFSQEDTKWGGGHGVFTYFLLEGLKGRADSNQDGRVTIAELAGYLSEQVRRATRSAQSPRLVGNFDPQLTLGR